MEKSKHHLFTYHEIRIKLVEILGEPKTDAEHFALHKEIKRVRKLIPIYKIDDDLHKKIHENESEYTKDLKSIFKKKNDTKSTKHRIIKYEKDKGFFTHKNLFEIYKKNRIELLSIQNDCYDMMIDSETKYQYFLWKKRYHRVQNVLQIEEHIIKHYNSQSLRQISNQLGNLSLILLIEIINDLKSEGKI